MSVLQDVPRKAMDTRLTTVLTDGTRRRIIRLLREDGGSLTEDDLAQALATAEDDVTASESADDAKQLRVRLRHVHLPKLAATGLVSWDDDDGVVTLRDGQDEDVSALEDAIAANADGDAIAAALADPRRLAVVAHLESSTGPTDRTALARHLASKEADGSPSPTLERDVETKLHHHHLPRLDEAGLVEYDHGAATVEYVGPSDLVTDIATIE